MKPNTEIVVTITKVRVRREQWAALETDQGDASGKIALGAAEGQKWRLAGEWGTNTFTLRPEFKFKSAIPFVPTDPRACLQYAIEKTKGFGAAMEAAIWETYGAGWADDPELSLLARQPSETALSAWQQTLMFMRESTEQVEAMTWLLSQDVSMRTAELAWAAWKAATIGKVQTNPYVLCELPRVAFVDIDRGIRLKLGFADDSPFRLRAGILHALEGLTARGDTVALVRTVQAEAAKLLRVFDDAALGRELANAKIEGALRAMGEYLALATDAANEEAIWEFKGAADDAT